MHKLLFICLGFLIFSCGRKDLGVIDYLNYYKSQSNGLIAIQKLDSVSLDASLKSRDFMALVNLNEGVLTLTNEQLKDARDQVENFTYVILNLGWDKKAQTPFSEADIDYYTNEIMKDVWLSSGSEKIICAVSNLESTMNPHEHRLILGFPKEIETLKEPLKLCISGRKIVKTDVCIEFTNFNSKSLPNLIAE